MIRLLVAASAAAAAVLLAFGVFSSVTAPAVRAAAAPAPADSAAMPRAARDEYDLGVVAADQKEWALAIRHFAAAQALTPENAKILYNLGLSHSQLDHLAGAAWLRASLAADPAAGAEKAAMILKEIRRLDATARIKVEKLFDTAIKVADQYVLPPKSEGPSLPWMSIPTAAPWMVGGEAVPVGMLQIEEDRKKSESNMKLWLKLDVADCAACVLSPDAALAIDKEVRGEREASARRDEARCFQHFRELWYVEDYLGLQEFYAAHKASLDARAAAVAKDPGAQFDAAAATCADSVFARISQEGRQTLAQALTAKADAARHRPLTAADWIALAKTVGDRESKLDIEGKIAAAAKDARSVTCTDIARLGVQLGECRLRVVAMERIAAAAAAN
jgi:hypothetical protein